MRKEAFNFITELIRIGKPGMKITRIQATRHMLIMYNPGEKDGAQSSCRNISDSIFAFYVRKGMLKRVERGKYEITTSAKALTYEDFIKDERERKSS